MEGDRKPNGNINNRNIQILIVEDEFILAASLQELLESLGYTVSGIADSFEAVLEQITQCRPDLVLMDVRLQGALDGIEAAKFIWNTARIPVIYLTGHSDRNTLERARETLPFGYLLKPVNVTEMVTTITVALNRCEQEQL